MLSLALLYCTVPACVPLNDRPFFPRREGPAQPWWTWERGVVGRSSRWLELGLCRSLDLTWQVGGNIRTHEVLYCTEEERLTGSPLLVAG
jgi:hypothetical protein